MNVTNFGNCSDILEPQVYLTSVRYDYVNGLCDTVHGTYKVDVAATDRKSKYEVKKILHRLLHKSLITNINAIIQLWIVSYQCPTNTLGACGENKRIRIEELNCDRLHGDKSGPWAMISDGMTGSKCGELAVSGKLFYFTLCIYFSYFTFRENFN